MSAGQTLFGRAYTLELQGTDGSAIAYGNMVTGQSPLRFSFELEKNSVGSSNKSSFVLYNLSPMLRRTLGKSTLMRLTAGYQGLTQTLFIGYCRTAVTTRSGSDITTTLAGGDGEYAIQYGTITKSWGPMTPLPIVLADVAKAMSVPNPKLPAQLTAGTIIGIPSTKYPNGFAFHGACRDALDIILKPLGIEWSVQNGALQILPAGSVLGEEAIVVSQSTGMINIPSINGVYTQFSALLNPNLRPGRLVNLVSPAQNFDGYFRIRSAKYEGDTHDSKWNVTCQCTKQEGTIVALDASQGFSIGGVP